MLSYIFKVCVNLTSQDQLVELVSQLDDHLCLGKIIPNDPIGLCLGVIKFEIDGDDVKLAIWTVNDDIDRPWVRNGGVEVDFSSDDLTQILLETATRLRAAAA